MENPKADPIFTIVSNSPITKNGDDGDSSWFIANSAIRMSVLTPRGAQPWKNVEMTGYVKIDSVTTRSLFGSNNNNNEDSAGSDIDWRARGGRHNNNVPCEGTALNGGIYVDGTVGWKKEIWHTGGYTDARGTGKAINSILDRWIGWKVVMYNINKNQAVKMESYLDDKSDNNWRKVSDVVDNGGWYANSSDKVFYSADCGRSKDYIITNEGPIATFRADNVALNFKDLSIREIQPPNS